MRNGVPVCQHKLGSLARSRRRRLKGFAMDVNCEKLKRIRGRSFGRSFISELIGGDFLRLARRWFLLLIKRGFLGWLLARNLLRYRCLLACHEKDYQ